MTLNAGLLVCRPTSLLACFAAVCYDLAPGTKLQIVPFATIAAKEGLPVYETVNYLYFRHLLTSLLRGCVSQEPFPHTG